MFRNPFHFKYKELIIFIIAYFILHYPPYSVLHILILKAATENYSLEQVFRKTKQTRLKVPGYNRATFVKLNSSRVIFNNFQLNVTSPYIFKIQKHLFSRNSSPYCLINIKLQEEKMIQKMYYDSSSLLNPQVYINISPGSDIISDSNSFFFVYCNQSFILVLFLHLASL